MKRLFIAAIILFIGGAATYSEEIVLTCELFKTFQLWDYPPFTGEVPETYTYSINTKNETVTELGGFTYKLTQFDEGKIAWTSKPEPPNRGHTEGYIDRHSGEMRITAYDAQGTIDPKISWKGTCKEAQRKF